jgi:hypothetical protein
MEFREINKLLDVIVDGTIEEENEKIESYWDVTGNDKTDTVKDENKVQKDEIIKNDEKDDRVKKVGKMLPLGGLMNMPFEPIDEEKEEEGDEKYCKRKWTKTWTDDEIDLLLKAVEIYGVGRWLEISRYVGTKDNKQVWTKYASILEKEERKKYSKHKVFTEEEDKFIFDWVEKNGMKRFEECGRILKATKIAWLSRYRRWIDPRYNRSKWTNEEKLQLLELYKAQGNDWRKFGDMLNRSTYDITKAFYQTVSDMMTEHFGLDRPNLTKSQRIEKKKYTQFSIKELSIDWLNEYVGISITFLRQKIEDELFNVKNLYEPDQLNSESQPVLAIDNLTPPKIEHNPRFGIEELDWLNPLTQKDEFLRVLLLKNLDKIASINFEEGSKVSLNLKLA